MPNEDVKVIKEASPEVGAVDHVLAVSRRVDGTPAQSPGFRSIDPEATAAISEAQMREQAVSNADWVIRSAQARAVDGVGDRSLDPVAEALKAAHDKAGVAGAAKAKSEKVQGA